MTDQQKDGGPAFATLHHDQGMSLRDWFAGQAMAGVAASIIEAGMDDGASAQDVVKTIASYSFSIADAMLAAREDKA
jgi:hypothetical protein